MFSQHANNNQKRRKIMKLPKQAIPVERNTVGAAISSENGVEASFPWLAAALPVVGEVIKAIANR
jgi:hypothetical protein